MDIFWVSPATPVLKMSIFPAATTRCYHNCPSSPRSTPSSTPRDSHWCSYSLRRTWYLWFPRVSGWTWIWYSQIWTVSTAPYPFEHYPNWGSPVPGIDWSWSTGSWYRCQWIPNLAGRTPSGPTPGRSLDCRRHRWMAGSSCPRCSSWYWTPDSESPILDSTPASPRADYTSWSCWSRQADGS